jgi:alpha-tubulin suppressor-like RCC1 family protein
VLAIAFTALFSGGCNQLFGIHDLNGGGDDRGDAGGTADAPPPGDWAHVAVDGAWTCAIRTDGSLWCWGSQPVVTGTDETAPTQLSNASWSAISGNSILACGLQSNGSLWCWGEGALGNGSSGESSTPLEIDAGPWTSVTVGDQDACAIKPDHTLWCWGFDYLGNLGPIVSPDGIEGYVYVPTQLDNNSYLAVDLDGDTICTLRTDHTVWCAGDLRFDAINTYPNGTLVQVASDWTTVSLSFSGACGITSDGHADCISETTGTEAPVDDRTDWAHIAIRGGICGTHTDGSLACWNGVEGLATGSATAPTTVDGGAGTWTETALAFDHLCGIGADANLWCVGNQANGQLGNGVGPHLTPTQLPGSNWASVMTWVEGTCAIDQTGSASCWGAEIGDGTYDVHQTPTPVGAWRQFSGGFDTVCGIKPDHTMFCWGANFYGDVGNGTTQSTLMPTLVTGNLTWQQVSVGFGGVGGEGSTCAIAGDNNLYCWGANFDGQLGDNGTEMTSPTPVRVELPVPAASVATGGGAACAIGTDKQTYCWGNNEYGQLDLNTQGSAQRTPIPVSTAFTQVVAGEEAACGLAGMPGPAQCWGDTPTLQVPGSWLSLSTSAGATTCGIQADQSLWCWGDNSSGELGDGTLVPSTSPIEVPGGKSWLSVSSGPAHTCAIDAAHQLWCWGDNSSGEIGDGTAIATTFQLVPSH